MAMRDDDKLVRQLSLVAYLMSQQRPVTADEIHEAVEGYGGMSDQAFLRRFYADRGEIEAMGLKLAVERPNDDPFQGDLYVLPAENYYLPQIDFTDRELSALQTCLYLLEGQFAYAEPLRLALQHLTLGRPSPLDDRVARTVSVNLLGGDYSPEVANHLSKIEAAITRRKTIRFPYYSIGRDVRSEREVDPYSLLYLGGNWYMVGLAHERQSLRLFRLSRIEGRITFKTRAEHDFTPPVDLDLARYRNRPPWQFEEGTEEAVIRLTPTVAWWVQQMFGDSGTLREDDDGATVFTTAYGSTRALLTWVLGLGSEAEVVDPPALRDAAAQAIDTVRTRHTGDDLPPAEVDASAPTADPEQVPGFSNASAGSSGPPPSPDKVVPAERFARLLALMTQLLAACGEAHEARVDVADILEQLNIDAGVLEEDLTLLNLINFGGGCYTLYAQVEGERIHVIKETYGDRFVRPARLSPLEAKALLWALEFIGDRLPTEADDALLSAREKVEAAIGEDNLPEVKIGRAAVANMEVSAAINAAIRHDRVLGIEYWTPSRDEITPRDIEPHLLVNSRDAWYVVAFCRRAQAQRTFRLDRIREATVRDETFARRAEIAHVEPDVLTSIGPSENASERAVVWCSPRVARWMVEEHDTHERRADGSAVVEIPYQGEDWVVKEVLKHQGEAVVMSPARLRQHVADLAARMATLYEVRARA